MLSKSNYWVALFLCEKKRGGMGEILFIVFVSIVVSRSVDWIIKVIREKRDVGRMVEKEMEQLKQ